MNGVMILATETTGGINMTEAVTSLMSVASTVMTTIQENATLMTYFCAGIVFVGIGVVKRLRG